MASGARGRVLVLLGTYTIGKERVLTAVSDALRCPVIVDDTKYELLSRMDFPMAMFTRRSDYRPSSSGAHCSVAAVPMLGLSYKKIANYLHDGTLPFLLDQPLSDFDQILAFLPTGWSGGSSGSYTRRQQGRFEVHSVPYSEHSDYNELLEFVEFLGPKGIVPTVDAASFEANEADFRRLCRPPPCSRSGPKPSLVMQ